MTSPDIIILPATEDALPFIRDSFVRSWTDAASKDDANELAQLLYRFGDRPAHALRYHLDIVLARSTTYVACAPESPSAYIGWMSATGDTLEYVYVKKAARRLGIARDLIKHAGCTSQALVTWPWTERLTRNDP